jgi:branched-chain amino acid transport system ATP-binding protein
MEETLVIQNVSVHFGGLKAVDNVSVTLPPKKIIGLIGPNGAGKTTLISAITGFANLASGAVYFKGTKMSGLRPDLIVRCGIARTFQIPHIPKRLKVGELLATAMDYTEHHAKAIGFTSPESLAGFCRITDLFYTECTSLTLPLLRRLELARVLALGPRLILVDEVMAGLGIQDTQDTLALLQSIHQLGVDMLVVEHVMSVITSLCPYTVVMSNGKLLTEGATEEVLSSPEVQKAYLGEDISFDEI